MHSALRDLVAGSLTRSFMISRDAVFMCFYANLSILSDNWCAYQSGLSFHNDFAHRISHCRADVAGALWVDFNSSLE